MIGRPVDGPDADLTGPDRSGPIRVLLIDAQPAMRLGIRAALDDCSDIVIVAEADGLPAGIQAMRSSLPDVVLLDVQLGPATPEQIFDGLRQVAPEVRVIAYTACEDPDTVFQVVEMGVHGYLLKGAALRHLSNAIRVVAAGGTMLEPGIAGKVVRHVQSAASRRLHQERTFLTPRESEVLRLLIDGLTNRGIADALGISERTVKYYVSRLIMKFEVTNRAGVVRAALEGGLVGDG